MTLDEPERLRRQIVGTQENLERIKQGLFTRSVNFEHDHTRGSFEPDRLTTKAADLIEKEQDLAELVEALRKTCGEIAHELDELKQADEITEQEAAILKLRYIERLPFKQIAKRLDISEATLYRHHRKALETFNAHPHTTA